VTWHVACDRPANGAILPTQTARVDRCLKELQVHMRTHGYSDTRCERLGVQRGTVCAGHAHRV
jgi:hypothetical protein